MASETTRMFRAVVVAGVSLTACSGAPIAVPTPGESAEQATPVNPVNDGKSTARPATAPVIPVNDDKSTGETAVAPVVTTVAVDAAPAGAGDPLAVPAEDATPVGAGDPLAVPAEDAKTEPRKPKKSAAERKREAEERKRREWEKKFPHIL